MKSLELLLVEDSHGDVVLVKEALKQTAVPVSLNVVYDGDAAQRAFKPAHGENLKPWMTRAQGRIIEACSCCTRVLITWDAG